MGSQFDAASRWFSSTPTLLETTETAEVIGAAMNDDSDNERLQEFEMEIKLPKIMPGPLTMKDGTAFFVGDKVSHPESGVGTILRILYYEDVGDCLYIDFGSEGKKGVHPGFVNKVQ